MAATAPRLSAVLLASLGAEAAAPAGRGALHEAWLRFSRRYAPAWGELVQRRIATALWLSLAIFVARLWRLRHLRLSLQRQRLVSEQEAASATTADDAVPYKGVRRSSSGSAQLEPVSRTFSRRVAKNDSIKQFGLPDDTFEIGARLDAGGQGTVYMCLRLSSGTEYAAKVINTSSLETSQRQLGLLRQEIRIMRELHHPRIVNLHEAFWEGNSCIIVMDLARAGNLYDRLEAEVREAGPGPFCGLGRAEAASKHVARQILEGLNYMHKKCMIHRDMKLENVLITHVVDMPGHKPAELLEIKIADFGLSKCLNVAGGRRGRMTAVGTPDYAAPEVLSESYDERADFWSLGVIVYATLCAEMPFDIRSMHPERHKEAVSRINAGESWRRASKDGQAFVSGLLTVEPDRRLGADAALRHSWLAKIGELESSFPTAASFGHMRMATGRVGAVTSISSHTGAVVNRVDLQLHDGSTRTCGDGAGVAQNSWRLEEDELIIAVMQDAFLMSSREEVCLGSALVFYTSACQIIAVHGTDARGRNRFVSPHGRQIAGLQFEGTRLTGIHLERIQGGAGAVEEIRGRTGSVVDRVTLRLRDGVSLTYGGAGGEECSPIALEEDEFIVVVEQYWRDRGLGGSLAFYTSAGRVLKLSGMTASRSRRFAVPKGRQLCGLEFSERDGRLARVATCPISGDLEHTTFATAV